MAKHKYPPSYTQWKAFVLSRQGLLPINEVDNVKVLCLACGLPTDLSASVPVIVGCVVSITEYDEVQIGEEVIEVPYKKYLPVSARGTGCQDCGWFLGKIERLVKVANKRLRKPITPWIEVEPRDEVGKVNDYYHLGGGV